MKDQINCISQKKSMPNLNVPHKSTTPNSKAMKTKSQALCLIAQGAKNTSPIPCKAAPIPK